MALALRQVAGIRKAIDSGAGLLLQPRRHAVQALPARMFPTGHGGAGGLAQASAGMWLRAALATLVHGQLTTTWEDWGEIVRLHDPDDYSGTPVHYFEAMLVTADVTKAARARLYNVTTATPVAESQVAMASSTPDRVRSPPFAFPSGENEYKAQIGEP